ncbi:hypothetical protein [Aquabacterium humicola]|uniref:hypothetical protein n=1 Tax=Aquabacterium humicola TaxID=3237377 RepID=UPI002542AE11|nr:hypothetical protein [Rubrivivax pictus]
MTGLEEGGSAWLDVSGTNQALVELYRPTLVAFMALNRASVPKVCGTGFVLAAAGGRAVVLTARHVFDDAAKHQRPTLKRPLAPGLFDETPSLPSTLPSDLIAHWFALETAGTLSIDEIAAVSYTDIAACAVSAGHTLNDAPFHAPGWPVHCTIPRVGDLVQMVSLGMDTGTAVVEQQAPADRTGIGQQLLITNAVRIRVGRVVGVYPNGYRQHRHPCFTTTIPVEPGMSGGLAFIRQSLHDSGELGVCGIASADVSPPEAFSDPSVAGLSIFACTWPVVGLPVPGLLPGEDGQRRRFHEAFQSGDLRALGGVGHLTVNVDGDRVNVRYRNPP